MVHGAFRVSLIYFAGVIGGEIMCPVNSDSLRLCNFIAETKIVVRHEQKNCVFLKGI